MSSKIFLLLILLFLVKTIFNKTCETDEPLRTLVQCCGFIAPWSGLVSQKKSI